MGQNNTHDGVGLLSLHTGHGLVFVVSKGPDLPLSKDPKIVITTNAQLRVKWNSCVMCHTLNEDENKYVDE